MASIASALVRQDTPEPEEPSVGAEAEGRLELPAGRGRDERDALVVKITRANLRLSSDNLLEYRVEICPKLLVPLVERGVKGKHPEPGAGGARGLKGAGKGKGPVGARRCRRYEDTDTEAEEEQVAEALQPAASQSTVGEEGDGGDDGGGMGKGKKKPKPKPEDNFLMWVPVPIMRHVHPDLILEFEEGKKKAPATRKKTTRADMATDEVPDAGGIASQAGTSRVPSARTTPASASGSRTNVNDGDASSQISVSTACRAPAKPKGKGKPRAQFAVDELREYALGAHPVRQLLPIARGH